jgi:hypothetical protein
MIIKTSELIGTQLDWAVARAEGKKVLSGPPIRVASIHKCLAGGYEVSKPYSPTTDWAIMGPIIERERISLIDTGHGFWGSRPKANFDKAEPEQFDRSPLIAAARCYVASKLGDEVDIPDNLVNKA